MSGGALEVVEVSFLLARPKSDFTSSLTKFSLTFQLPNVDASAELAED
jgi:hypothetical protein